MGSKLKEFQNKIFSGDYSDEEWVQINRSVQKEFQNASDDEKQEFIDSGAGNLLAQIMEYMD